MFEGNFKVLVLCIILGFNGKLRAKTQDIQNDFRGPFVSADQWIESEVNVSIPKIFQNVSPRDAKTGIVVAAQTRNNPNYYFHWVRDAALTMEALIDRYNFNLNFGAEKSTEQQIIKRKLMEYFDLSDHLQTTRAIEGLGEPKFNIDGSAYNEPWGRPQNDGPALRALSFIHLAKILINEGQIEFVKSRFYNGKLGAGSVIKRDLEFVSHEWRKSSFDLWEEVKADHFYTRMVQRRALREGADFASTMGDSGAANWYATQANEIETDLMSFWDAHRGYFIATKNRVGGIDYKNSQLDTAVILGLLHGSLNDGFLPFRDLRIQETMNRIASSFQNIYGVNHKSNIPGIAIGRYPEDVYGGANFNAGNPWVLCTLAFAEAYYRMADEYSQLGQNNIANDLIQRGDSFVMRVQYHAHPNGALNEQYDRNNGYMTSVEDLTWNYGSVLTTYFARIKGITSLQASMSGR